MKTEPRFVWIDSAPLIASPQPTGRVVRFEVLLPDRYRDDPRMYGCTEQGSPLYVSKGWIRPAPKDVP